VPDIASSDAVSPDGTLVAYQGTDQEGRDVIYVANIDGTNIRALEKTATTAADELDVGEFSPDGSQIVYQARPYGNLGSNQVGDLFLVDMATGETTELTHLKPVSSDLWFMDASFSPDGQTVFFTRPTSNRPWGLWSAPASGGKPRLVLRDAIGGHLSPDGRTIVYFNTKPSPDDPLFGGMWLADADGTDARRLAAHCCVERSQGEVDRSAWVGIRSRGPTQRTLRRGGRQEARRSRGRRSPCGSSG
jgi:Tol biopolymer transport system component